ncbi:MAG: hypothetical protein WC477_02480 [Patescibacteria group bacterium]
MSESMPSERPIDPRQTVFRITDIEYSNSQMDEKIVGVFRFEPTGASKNGPTIIVIAEIDGVGYVYDQLIDVVNSEAEHARTLLSHVEQEPVSRFEKVIQSVNRAVGEFVKGEPSPINWNRVNMYILELSDGHMCLAGIGRLMNMFLQHQGDGTYKTFDLFGSLDQRVDVQSEKVFSNIICGDFKPGDMLIAGSKNFERIRNELRIKERLTTLPPVTATLEIKQDLEVRGTPDDFVAILIACKEAEVQKSFDGLEPRIEEQASTASIEKLRHTEAETLRHLAPSILRKEGKTDPREPVAPRIGAVTILKRALGFIRNKFRREKLRDVASMANLRGMHAGFGSFFTRKKKTIIVSSVAIVVLLIVGSLVIKHQQTLAAERAAWNASYDKIMTDLNQAEGEAVYSADVSSRTLQNAISRIASLDTSTKDRKEAVQKLQDQMNSLRKKLQRSVSVDNPTTILSLSDGLADGALVSPILFQGKLVVANNAGNKILVSDGTSSPAKEIAINTNGSKVIALGAGKTSVIAMLQNGSLIGIDITKGEASPLSIGSSDMKTPTDMTAYNGKLYVLDATNQQIWKFLPSSGGFGNASKYLQAGSTSLSNAVSLSIDSNIYVLTSAGSVARYFNGGQDGFSLAPIDPPMTSGNQIWTDPDSQYVVVADASNKRVVVFTKDGHLVSQLVSSAFKGPTDIIGDAKSKNLYVVDGNRVFQLLLP